MKLRIWRNEQFRTWQPNLWDMAILVLIFCLFIILAFGASKMATPYQVGEQIPIDLNYKNLPYYSLRTFIRMFIALLISLLFTFIVGALAAKNHYARQIIIPLIDILQSVPVLAFLSITILFFINLFPNSLLGPEFAVIFTIFTTQAWNMTLSFYQNLRLLPRSLRETAALFQLNFLQRFFYLDVPFAMPSLIWNMMISMSASWFMIVASEAITVNNQTIFLPGIGSYIATAIIGKEIMPIIYAIIAMLLVIIIYDQLLFKPLVVWSEKFKLETTYGDEKVPYSLIAYIFNRSRLLIYLTNLVSKTFKYLLRLQLPKFRKISFQIKGDIRPKKQTYCSIWYITITLLVSTLLILALHFVFKNISYREVLHVIFLGGITCFKIIVLVILASLVWLPIGFWIGMRPKVAQFIQPIIQFLAAFPVNLIYPIVVILIVNHNWNAHIWTAPLLVLGTQWYILFNVIAGTSTFPKHLIYISENFGLKRWLRWKRIILPAIFPYLLTGMISATGGAWNASILAEYVRWGDTIISTLGIGSYFTYVTSIGDFPKEVLGILVMCIYILLFNRLLWHPLYNLAEKRFQLE